MYFTVVVSILLSPFLSYPIRVNGYDVQEGSELYEIEGKVYPQESLTPNPKWLTDTKVVTKGGLHIGFLR